jgi:hypothetical protein
LPLLLLAADNVPSVRRNSCATNVADLRSKYPWGEICLTFSALSDLAAILQSQPKLTEIAVRNDEEALRAFAAHLVANIKKINEGMSMLIIDLNVDPARAGWKRADDMNGAIVQLPWKPSQIVCIANLCDQYLAGRLRWQKAKDEVARATSVSDIWSTWEQIQSDPYVSARSVASLKVDLSHFIETHPDKLRSLEHNDQSLFAKVKAFSDAFDESTRTLVATVTAVNQETHTITTTQGPNSPPVTVAYSPESTLFINDAGSKASLYSLMTGSRVGIQFAGNDPQELAARKLVIGKPWTKSARLEAVAAKSFSGW